MKHMVVLLVGSSASGKDSVAHELVKQGYKQLRSYATRPQRVNEGNTHIFITNDDVDKYKKNMVAYTQIAEYQYFATRQQLEESDIYIIDPTGVKYLKQIVKDIKFITIHINLPEEVRFQRAIRRGDNKGDIIKRFIDETDRFYRFLTDGEYDYSITNFDLDKTVQIVKNIIELEKVYE